MERSTRPAEIARHTVERNGGEYTTSVVELLSLFGYSELTDQAREEIRDALRAEQVGTDPGLFALETRDQVRLYLLEPQGAFVAPPSGGPAEARAASSSLARLRPRTWKGWTGYGIAALLIVVALTGDSEDPGDARPAAEAVEEPVTAPDADAEAREEQRAARALRRERARLRRARAQVRRERAEARRERAEARRRREERLEAQTAAPPEPEPAASCHPSYEPCLDPNASDYDCEGGSGDGPKYTSSVTVTGPDDYDLDSDGDGTGCDS